MQVLLRENLKEKTIRLFLRLSAPSSTARSLLKTQYISYISVQLGEVGVLLEHVCLHLLRVSLCIQGNFCERNHYFSFSKKKKEQINSLGFVYNRVS